MKTIVHNPNRPFFNSTIITKTIYAFVLATLVVFTACDKYEYEDTTSSTNEIVISTSDNFGNLFSLQDTLNFLHAEAAKLDLPTDFLNELPGPNVKVSGTEFLQILDPATGAIKEREVQIINGNLIAEGDMILATETEYREQLDRSTKRGVVTIEEDEKWPNGVIPYEIAPGHSKMLEILIATTILTASTNLTIKPRTNETDYVYFPITDELNSWIGKQGFRQVININSRASLGNIMHEFLHAAGMEHEQNRCDRDEHVHIYWEHIKADKEHNFDKACGDDRADYYAYDYGSIMHYGATYFSTDRNNKFTILPTWNGDVLEWLGNISKMGQRETLSETDIKTINRMYPR